MTDSTLQRVWESREAISRRCDFDTRKLIRFYQSRQKTKSRTKKSTVPAGGRERAPAVPCFPPLEEQEQIL